MPMFGVVVFEYGDGMSCRILNFNGAFGYPQASSCGDVALQEISANNGLSLNTLIVC